MSVTEYTALCNLKLSSLRLIRPDLLARFLALNPPVVQTAILKAFG